MKNKLIIKNTKNKFYHKLLNNEVVYDKKPLKRYKQNITSAHLKDKFKNLDLLKNKINKSNWASSQGDFGFLSWLDQKLLKIGVVPRDPLRKFSD